MSINEHIRKQLITLRELDLIIFSPDFHYATFENQRKLIDKKQSGLKKLEFLYNLEGALISEKNKENAKRI